MSPTAPHPDESQLRRLLAGTLNSSEEADVLAHLEREPAWQSALDQLVADEATWRAAAQSLVKPPLAALRLCVAAGATAAAIDAVFNAIWRDGRLVDSAQALAGEAAALGIADAAAAIADPAVKETLRANTDAALAAGVFGVPTLAIGEDLFWGNDSHELMLAVLDDPGLLREGPLAGAAVLPVGIERRAR